MGTRRKMNSMKKSACCTNLMTYLSLDIWTPQFKKSDVAVGI